MIIFLKIVFILGLFCLLVSGVFEFLERDDEW